MWHNAASVAVHPHGRGEHGLLLGETLGLFRFIPTGVGNIGSSPRCPTKKTVHPHGRGEHRFCGRDEIAAAGSSPRAWGTCPCPLIFPTAARFIPTGVGNILANCTNTLSLTVHPHGRGEHAKTFFLISFLLGSSPRAWGTFRIRCSMYDAERFIPTGVGNIPIANKTKNTSPVHPHGRGEHRVSLALNGAINGSSPRAWGTCRSCRHGAR